MPSSIPAAHGSKFENGICHPVLYLWDAWSYMESNIMHLYCLAVPRLKSDGTPLKPSERNNFPFHVRHFTSKDYGESWKDEGCFAALSSWPQSQHYCNIWSGSVELLPNGRKLVALTGIEEVNPDHNFLQSILLGVSNDGYAIDQVGDSALSSPRRDWDEITNLGYYLDVPEKLGNNEGEEDGPILSWRDPFIFLDGNGEINLFWGAKVSPRRGALARAIVQKDGGFYKMAKLFPPTTVPNGSDFTQLELPKVLYDKEGGIYYLLISTCNRLYEGQSDAEVDKGVRIYKSNSIEGPWEALGAKILGSENLFGPTVLDTDFKNNRLLCIAPYTEAAESDLRLTFSPVFYIYLDALRVEFL